MNSSGDAVKCQSDARRVAFIVSSFPEQSQTFIFSQIIVLLQAGYEVDIYSLFRPALVANHELVRTHKLVERTHYLLPDSEQIGRGRTRVLLSIPALLLKTLLDRAGPTFGEATRLLCAGNITGLRRLNYLSRLPAIKSDYTALIAHFGQMGIYASQLKRSGVLRGPLAVAYHGFDMSQRNFLKQWRPLYPSVFRQAELLLPVSQHWARQLGQWGAPASKIQVLHMGVDVPASQAAKTIPKASTLRVLTVARATEKKGLRYAIEAIAASDVPTHARFIGDGEELKAMKALATRLGCIDKIDFEGSQTSEYIKQALGWADVFLLPSVTADNGDQEGIPVALMEAMANGVLVISSRHSGIPELIEHGRTGLLAAETDSQAIADLLRQVYHREIGPGIREAGYAEVKDKFNNNRLGAKLIAMIDKLQA